MDRQLKLFEVSSWVFEDNKQANKSSAARKLTSIREAQNEVENDDSPKSPEPPQKFPSFHEVLGPILTVAQCFGNLPVIGVLDKDHRNLKFKWRTFRTIYSLVYMVICFLEVCLMVLKGIVKGISIVNVELIMFYFDAVTQTAVFFYLATQWKEFMTLWHKMEKPFLFEPYTMRGLDLTRKARIIGVIMFISYLIEHFMSIALNIQVNFYQLSTCNVTDISPLENYFRRQRTHLHDILPFRWWVFPPFQWTITLMAFSWNFVDYFIIILSLGISTRFNQLNQRLRSTKCHQMVDKFWLDIRLHYTNLVDLLEFVDEKISLLVLFSMSHNLFLVCTKVFEAIKYSNRQFFLDDVYFYFYLFFLISRTLSVLYYGSSINNASSYALVAIRRTPTSQWSENLKRLSDMIQTEDVSLSGSKFFFITRQMILMMIGTVVTFELVLLDRGKRGEEEDNILCLYFEKLKQH